MHYLKCFWKMRLHSKMLLKITSWRAGLFEKRKKNSFKTWCWGWSRAWKSSGNALMVSTSTNRRQPRQLITKAAETLCSDQPLCGKSFSPSREQNQFPVLSDFSAAVHPVISICRHSLKSKSWQGIKKFWRKKNQVCYFIFFSSQTNTSSFKCW